VYPDLGVIATGSSSFDLRNRASDALTGRYIDFTLYPLSLGESYPPLPPEAIQPCGNLMRIICSAIYCCTDVPRNLYRGNPTFRKEQLTRLVESYLFKDIFTFERIQRSQAIVDLARALAYQIGNTGQ